MTPAAKCAARPELLLAEEEQAEERRLREEREHALHREREADHAAGVVGEARPVGAELELHRDAGDDADDEVDPEDARPEAREVVVAAAFASSRDRSASALNTRITSARPIVSCGNR